MLNHPLIEFVGEISDAEKDDFLGNAMALVCPYYWPEPFGLVLIEALDLAFGPAFEPTGAPPPPRMAAAVAIPMTLPLPRPGVGGGAADFFTACFLELTSGTP